MKGIYADSCRLIIWWLRSIKVLELYKYILYISIFSFSGFVLIYKYWEEDSHSLICLKKMSSWNNCDWKKNNLINKKCNIINNYINTINKWHNCLSHSYYSWRIWLNWDANKN